MATPATLASFNGYGGYPEAGLIADAGGDLFGETAFGGADGRTAKERCSKSPTSAAAMPLLRPYWSASSVPTGFP